MATTVTVMALAMVVVQGLDHMAQCHLLQLNATTRM